MRLLYLLFLFRIVLSASSTGPKIVRLKLQKQIPTVEPEDLFSEQYSGTVQRYSKYADTLSIQPAKGVASFYSNKFASSSGSSGSGVSFEVVNNNDQAYYANISLGTPPQHMVVQIDTGSAAFWVGGIECNKAGLCNDLSPFDPAASSTFSDTSNGAVTNVTYGVGMVSGKMSGDVLSWGDLQLARQQFILVDYEDPIIASQQAKAVTGLVGFAYQGGLKANVSSPGYYQTPIAAFIANGLISQPMFSLWLNGSTIGGIQADGGGEMILGGIDPELCSSPPRYYPVSKIANNYFWMIQMTSIKTTKGFDVNNPTAAPSVKTLKTKGSATTYAIIDSGTTFIIVDPNFYSQQLIPSLQKNSIGEPVGLVMDATGATRVSCKDSQRLPSVGFTFGGPGIVASNEPLFEITWQDYVFSDSKGCFLGFVAMNAKSLGDGNSPVWILGDSFLRKVYSVYDMGNGGRVGLAYSAKTGSAFVEGLEPVVDARNGKSNTVGVGVAVSHAFRISAGGVGAFILFSLVLL
ncbi:aspartic peptidase domain-containing protein [Obelidium mucronatum]|nr:aspartic peptidase domain-containing protein [Obelidium mucronatum]